MPTSFTFTTEQIAQLEVLRTELQTIIRDNPTQIGAGVKLYKFIYESVTGFD